MCKINYIQTNFSHHPMTNLQLVPEQRSWTPQIFANFIKFQKKAELSDKRGFELPENRQADSLLPPSQRRS